MIQCDARADHGCVTKIPPMQPASGRPSCQQATARRRRTSRPRLYSPSRARARRDVVGANIIFLFPVTVAVDLKRDLRFGHDDACYKYQVVVTARRRRSIRRSRLRREIGCAPSLSLERFHGALPPPRRRRRCRRRAFGTLMMPLLS